MVFTKALQGHQQKFDLICPLFVFQNHPSFSVHAYSIIIELHGVLCFAKNYIKGFTIDS